VTRTSVEVTHAHKNQMSEHFTNIHIIYIVEDKIDLLINYYYDKIKWC